MIQSQRLNTIKELFTSNKNSELSFFAGRCLESRDVMSSKYREVIENKYKGFENIEGVFSYTYIVGDSPINNIFRRLFKRNIFLGWFQPDLDNGTKIDTRFIIQDRKLFIHSLLSFIDEEKETLHIRDNSSSQRYVLDLVKSSKEKLGVTKFPLSFTIKKYLSEPVLIYEQILSLQGTYKIENIQIFQGNIVFTLSQIAEEKINVEYKDGEIFINKKPIKFKKVDGGNKTEEIFHLIFQYFQEYNVNSVTYFDLEEYLKTHKQFKILEKLKFTDEGMRGYLSGKNTGIKKDFGISNFLSNNVSSIQCEYFVPLKT